MTETPNIRRVGKTHYITQQEGKIWNKRATRAIKSFNTNVLYDCEATHSIVATSKGEMVGFFRYKISPKGKRFSAAGTWVQTKYRNSGLAKRMWNCVMKDLPVNARVKVITISKGGDSLVNSMRDKWEPKIKFDHSIH